MAITNTVILRIKGILSNIRQRFVFKLLNLPLILTESTPAPATLTPAVLGTCLAVTYS